MSSTLGGTLREEGDGNGFNASKSGEGDGEAEDDLEDERYIGETLFNFVVAGANLIPKRLRKKRLEYVVLFPFGKLSRKCCRCCESPQC
ncbi:hypothetical protein SUGI_0577050 [Cryptomeria japonica]|nr:hypothetical protein SUGI_0577050 [Cryptomeria japonica]